VLKQTCESDVNSFPLSTKSAAAGVRPTQHFARDEVNFRFLSPVSRSRPLNVGLFWFIAGSIDTQTEITRTQ